MAGHTYESMQISGHSIVLAGNLSINNISGIPGRGDTDTRPCESRTLPHVYAGNAIAQLYSQPLTQQTNLLHDTAKYLSQCKASLDSFREAIHAASNGYLKPEHQTHLLDLLRDTSDLRENLDTKINNQEKTTTTSPDGAVTHNGSVYHCDEILRLRESLDQKLYHLVSFWQSFELPQRINIHQEVMRLQQSSSGNKASIKTSTLNSGLLSPPASPISKFSEPVSADSTATFMKVYRGSCIDWCPCKCHRQSLGTAMNFSPVLGFLLLCMSGGNFSFHLHDCKRCKAQQPMKLKLSYFLPMWLSAFALHIMLTIRANTYRPLPQLRWSHMCSATSDLFKFAEMGNTAGIKELFKNRLAHIYDVAVSTGKTALHCAVIYNRKDTVRFLLAAGADASQEDKQRDSATHIAWQRIYGKLAGGDVAEDFQTLFTQDPDYFDNLNFNIFHKLVLSDNHLHLERHLRLNELVGIDHKDIGGRTPLSWAASRGDAKMAILLLEAGADPDICGRDGRTPLHWAAQSSNPATMEALILHKANVHALCSMSRTALHYAACNHNDDRYVEILLDQEININARDRHDRTALGYAVSKSRPITTRFLLRRGADPTLADNFNHCPLIEAARESHHDTLQCLVREKASCLRWDAQTNQGMGVLHIIAQHGNFETLEIIGLERCREMDWEMEDRLGRTPLQIAKDRSVIDERLVQAFEDLSRTETVRAGERQAQ